MLFFIRILFQRFDSYPELSIFHFPISTAFAPQYISYFCEMLLGICRPPLPDVAWDSANAPVFVSHASFPGIPLRKSLLEIVCYIMWIFGEYPVAVLECWCQDVVSKRQRSAFFDCKVYGLCSPKTQTRNQLRWKYSVNTCMQCNLTPINSCEVMLADVYLV